MKACSFAILLVFSAALFQLGCGGSSSAAQAKATPSIQPEASTSSPGSSAGDPSAGSTTSSGNGPSSGSGSSSGSSGGSGTGSSGTSNSGSSSGNGNSDAKSFSNLDQQNGWTGYALLPSAYSICSSCQPSGPQVTWSRTTGVSSPSLSGNSTEHTIGGTTAYADVLWNNHLIGDYSSQDLPDSDQTLAPSLHNFTYDVYFYASDFSKSQALEFDINQFVDGKSYIWGHECRIAAGNEWDIWDDQKQKWHPTGVGCWPQNKSWNHLTIQVQRTSDGHLLFQSITLNGKTATLNYYEEPSSTNWYGVTINYQQDGNANQKQYSVWLDKLTFSYW